MRCIPALGARAVVLLPLTPFSQDNQTPLHVACYKGHTGAVQVLLANKACVNAVTKVRNTCGPPRLPQCLRSFSHFFFVLRYREG